MTSLQILETMVGIQNICITLSNHEEILNKCTEFANSSLHSANYYKSIRVASHSIQNIITGKYGEFVVCNFLKKNSIMTEVDTHIYGTDLKGWDSDLKTSDNINIAVKTCDSKTIEKIGDLSWTFQMSKTNGHDTIFNSNEKFIFLVFVSNITPVYQSRILFIHHPFFLKNYLKDPKFSKYIGAKKCLYWADLKN